MLALFVDVGVVKRMQADMPRYVETLSRFMLRATREELDLDVKRTGCEEKQRALWTRANRQLAAWSTASRKLAMITLPDSATGQALSAEASGAALHTLWAPVSGCSRHLPWHSRPLLDQCYSDGL